MKAQRLKNGMSQKRGSDMSMIVREVRNRCGVGGHHEYEEFCSSITSEFLSDDFAAFWEQLSVPGEGAPAESVARTPAPGLDPRLIHVLSLVCVT
jgi:hypothetical protein